MASVFGAVPSNLPDVLISTADAPERAKEVFGRSEQVFGRAKEVLGRAEEVFYWAKEVII
jgi:hypothetical protein